MIDMTTVLQALIGLAVAVITAVVIPWIRAKVGEAKWAQLQQIAIVAVHAAEQLYQGSGQGEKKLEHALEQVQLAMKKQGLTFDAEVVKTAIEAAVLGLKSGE